MKKFIYIRTLWFFFLERNFHNRVRRETKNCFCDLSVDALERQGLDASFDLYTGITNWVIIALRWIEMIPHPVFFSEKSSHTRKFCVFFTKKIVHKLARRAVNNYVIDMNRSVLEKGDLTKSKLLREKFLFLAFLSLSRKKVNYLILHYFTLCFFVKVGVNFRLWMYLNKNETIIFYGKLVFENELFPFPVKNHWIFIFTWKEYISKLCPQQ